VKTLHISLREDQHDAVTKLAELASTSASDVIRQALDLQADQILAAIEVWRTHGGLMNPAGNMGKKKKRKTLGFRAL
jgi:hypothetical protein